VQVVDAKLKTLIFSILGPLMAAEDIAVAVSVV
jgi:hypothetical protein